LGKLRHEAEIRVPALLFLNLKNPPDACEIPLERLREVECNRSVQFAQVEERDRRIHVVLSVIIHMPVKVLQQGSEHHGMAGNPPVGHVGAETEMLLNHTPAAEEGDEEAPEGHQKDENPELIVNENAEQNEMAYEDEAGPVAHPRSSLVASGEQRVPEKKSASAFPNTCATFGNISILNFLKSKVNQLI